MCYAAGITVQGPAHVSVGDQFQLRYVIATTDVKGFRIGNVPDGFDVLMGPSTSTQQSFSIINGQTKHTSSITYTFVLMAKKAGTFVVQPAKATVSGNAASSQALKITVSGGGGSARAQQGGGGQQQRPAMRVDRAGSNVRSGDLFLRATANKQRVYEQEPVLLTYKVYTLVELTMLEGKMPDLQGFHTQEIPLPQQKTYHVENVNGRPYNCVTWSQYVMYPQMSGKLTVPSIAFKGTVMQENPNVDPFEAFFNGGSGYIETKKVIQSPSVDIEVVPLPAKPAGFSGGVGQFTMTASLDKNSVKAGDPVNIRVVISGTGNMKLLKQPELSLPKDFDKYDAKVTDKTKLTVDGVTGSMIYDMLVVPRNKGEYTIPAIKYIYFDTLSKQYKTLTSQPMTLQVEKGNGNSNVSDYSQQNDNDIHDLMAGDTNKQNVMDTFFTTPTYMIINVVVLLTFVILLVIFRRRALALADVTAMRGKRANKVAAKRLKKAAKLMSQGKQGEFYDEVMRALWGYVGDKLSMPVEQLSRDNITQQLSVREISKDVVDSFVEAIDECEYARYAPGDSSGNMQKTYDKATTAITAVDESFHK